MGYRSTFITNDFYSEIPDWFVEKYGKEFNFGNSNGKPYGVIASKGERKFYRLQNEEVFSDIAKLIEESNFNYSITGALVHEDGLITRITITAKSVKSEHLSADGDNWQLGESGELIINEDIK